MREWYADYLEACNRHDLDAIRSFVDPRSGVRTCPAASMRGSPTWPTSSTRSPTGAGAASSSSSRMIVSRRTCGRAAHISARSGASRRHAGTQRRRVRDVPRDERPHRGVSGTADNVELLAQLGMNAARLSALTGRGHPARMT